MSTAERGYSRVRRLPALPKKSVSALRPEAAIQLSGISTTSPIGWNSQPPHCFEFSDSHSVPTRSSPPPVPLHVRFWLRKRPFGELTAPVRADRGRTCACTSACAANCSNAPARMTLSSRCHQQMAPIETVLGFFGANFDPSALRAERVPDDSVLSALPILPR